METVSDWLVGVMSKTEYIRQGTCKRCGRCCRLLALEMPRFIAKYDRFVGFLGWWHKVLFNFQFQGREGRWLIYRCGYLIDCHPEATAEGSRGDHGILRSAQNDIRCRIYPFRHRICRFYPTQRLYGHPKTHPECGFRFVRRDGRPSFDEILDEKKKSL